MVVGSFSTLDTFRSYSYIICYCFYFFTYKGYGRFEMSRTYGSLECGCFVSCDGGGAILFSCERTYCKFKEYMNRHESCGICSRCLICENHFKCEELEKALMED